MNHLIRTLRLHFSVGVLTVGLLPVTAWGDDAEEFAQQPLRPRVKANLNRQSPPVPPTVVPQFRPQTPPPLPPTVPPKLPATAPPKLDPTAPGAKIDAMDPPKGYLKPTNAPFVPPFRDSYLGAHSHLGRPDDGGVGYLHYDHPPFRYDLWYRPDAFGWGRAERCAPAPFRPRGYGNLFAEPSTCYRMDYNRYVLRNYGTDYGPSYYRRLPSPTCNTYDHSDKHRPDCDPTRLQPRDGYGPGGTRVWTLGRHHHHD